MGLIRNRGGAAESSANAETESEDRKLDKTADMETKIDPKSGVAEGAHYGKARRQSQRDVGYR